MHSGAIPYPNGDTVARIGVVVVSCAPPALNATTKQFRLYMHIYYKKVGAKSEKKKPAVTPHQKKILASEAEYDEILSYLFIFFVIIIWDLTVKNGIVELLHKRTCAK